MPTIKFTAPREIEGSTDEVLKATLSQLEAAAPTIHELLDQSMVQVRNAWMSFELGADPELSSEDLATKWNASELRQEVEHVRAAGLLIHRNTQRIARSIHKRS